MRGPRPYYKPTEAQNLALAERNQTRVYTEEYRNSISEKFGHSVFAYSREGKFLGYFPSINKAKRQLNVKLHTVTIQRHMKKLGVNNPQDMIWSHTLLPYNKQS